MYRILFGIKTIFLLIWTVVFITPAQGQLYLSENSYDGPIPQGPAGKVSAVQLLKRADNGRYEAPDVKTTFQLSISNPQIKADGISEVLSFGSNSRETLKWPSSEFVFKEMKSLGSPLSSFFTAGSQMNEGIMTTSNFGYWLFASVKHLSKSSFPKPGESQYLADLTITFNRSVTNPVIHLVGLGGIVTVEGIIRGFSVELEMTHPSAYLEKVSGSEEFGVNPDRIYNVAERFDGDCGAGAACGSVKVIGSNLTELTFKVHMRRDVREDGYRGRWPLMRNMQGGDGFLVGVSFDDNGMVSGRVHTITDSGMTGQNKLGAVLLRVNLIDPSDNRVLASKPVEDDGSYTFDGLTLLNPYEIQLNTIKGMVGELPPPVELPEGWNLTGLGSESKQAQSKYLFDLDSSTQKGFDYYLTNLTEEQLVQATVIEPQNTVEKTPTEIYLEEREKLALARKEKQRNESPKEVPLPALENEPSEDLLLVDDLTKEQDSIAEMEPVVEVEVEEPIMVEVEEPIMVEVEEPIMMAGEEPNLVEVEEPAQADIKTESDFQTQNDSFSERDKYISMDATPMQQVIIVGSGQDRKGISALLADLKSLGREVYKGEGPNGMVRVGYYVSDTNLEEELEWARRNVVSDAWILDQVVDNPGSTSGMTPPSADLSECLIIVGSFAQMQNVERMFQKVMASGLKPYKGKGPRQLTRVGFYVDCMRRFEELTAARKEFDAESWIKPEGQN